MADPRYKNGVFRSRQPSPITQCNNPAAFGWTWIRFSTEYKQHIWQRDGYKLMRYPDLTKVMWVVEHIETGQQWIDKWSLETISRTIRLGKYSNDPATHAGQ